MALFLTVLDTLMSVTPVAAPLLELNIPVEVEVSEGLPPPVGVVTTLCSGMVGGLEDRGEEMEDVAGRDGETVGDWEDGVANGEEIPAHWEDGDERDGGELWNFNDDGVCDGEKEER